jgi:hypothetical protein
LAIPAVFLAHVTEEAPRFTDWVRRNASDRYRQRDFIRINALGFVTTLGATAMVTRHRSRPLDLTYYTVPVWWQLTCAAVTEGRLTKRDVAACTAIAGLVHAGVVARQVFGVPQSAEHAHGACDDKQDRDQRDQ